MLLRGRPAYTLELLPDVRQEDRQVALDSAAAVVADLRVCPDVLSLRLRFFLGLPPPLGVESSDNEAART
jgi:hypothetical protein